MKAQEYSLEEKYKNLLDVVNDLRKRVKSLEIQNQPGMIGSGMMGPGMMGPGMMGPGMIGPGMMGPGMIGPGMMGPEPISNFHRNIQPTNMMEMNQPPITSQIPPNPQTSAPSKYIFIKFLFKDIEVIVQGKDDITVENLIKNFRMRLCDENIRIEKYIILPTRVELDPHSTETLASKGITEGTKINAVSK